ncbi:Single-stranded DNA-binding replication protein A (RPA), medium (30 kD) subunit [Trachipleistophora hominis]|uniref:Single-stranded DNA-binding replication protein A (RPA), medium (30 kD) subunit n=1 Tax=Trachipleistophora hominis TaxID=72359 RepID=L7JWZ1_TRAHO|nr:Single-stranded DNA-binding replication protein A (RPA), medium (30 kD) subunit [Trachipleistophora hominis]
MPLSDNQGFIPSSPKPDYTPKSLRTLSIKQLKSLPTDTPTHTIDNTTLSTICVAGWVRSTRQAQSGTIFLLDDGTAMINASFWPNGLFEEEQAGLIEPSNFLRVIGNVRVYDGDISVSVSFLTKIDDFNYVSYHFLNVLQQHLYCRRELKRDTRKNVEKGMKTGTLQEDVLMCYRNNQDEKGLHVDLVVKMLQGKYKEQDVREMVNSLLDDCYLFSVDGMCYKTVD